MVAVNIKSVIKKSPAFAAGVRAGDTLTAINGHEISDVLDYMFYTGDGINRLELLRDGKNITVSINKNKYEDLGLEFDSFLMDDKQSCGNKCVFCFIDQNPAGMRETLYFKDDDSRLSFLQGNYVTLNGLSERELLRIIKMRLTVNISVHTTNPELRRVMMSNPFAGEKLGFLKRLADAGIEMNCQIVLCPGLNDGAEFINTLNDLGELYPAVKSIAAVPVGLTKHRGGLHPLNGFDKRGAEEVLRVIAEFQESFLSLYGTRLVFAADELYLMSNIPIPSGDCYEEYRQYDNGVGMLRSFCDEFMYAAENRTQGAEPAERNISVATGAAAYKTVCGLVQSVVNKWKRVKCNVYKIKNNFYGETVTVAGLLTASDIIEQLNGKDLGDLLLLSASMINTDGLFLDNYTIPEVEEQLGVRIRLVENDGGDFFCKLTDNG